jgi:hypothetical protein
MKREFKHYKDYQSYTAYLGNEDSKLHRQSTGGCASLELSIIFKKDFTSLSPMSSNYNKREYTYGWYSASVGKYMIWRPKSRKG